MLGAVLLLAHPAVAGPTLQLRRLPGPGITVAVSMNALAPSEVAGYQVFLEFDPSVMRFDSGLYLIDQMGLVLTGPIAAQGSRITLAAGINAFAGQQPTSADADLAILSFTPVVPGCEARIRFRQDSVPPTRLSDADGVPVTPLTLRDLWPACRPDMDGDGILSVQDIFDFLSKWFAGSCEADFDRSGTLGVQDIFGFLAAWFSEC